MHVVLSIRDGIYRLLTSEKVDVVATTETFLSEDILNSELVMRPTLQSLDRIVIVMEEAGSCWSFEVKSLLSVEMTLRLIVNFYG